LGRREEIERRDSSSKCYNDKDYVRDIVTKNCSCTSEDFEW